MSSIKNAIFLVAGLGSRLRPITDENPKCLTELNNTTILENSLKSLSEIGVRKIVLVIGYKGDKIIDRIGKRYAGMDVEYITNSDYSTTNSMYSLWMARETLSQGAYVLEGDIFYGNDFAAQMSGGDQNRSYWLLAPYQSYDSGSMSIVDDSGRINEIRIVREKLEHIPKSYYKSTGILRVTADYGKKLSDWLTTEVQAKNTNVYFDQVIAKHVSEEAIYAMDVAQSKWVEIDDLNDLRRAEKLFMGRKYVVLVIDGASDYPLKELEGKTPFEHLELKNINRLTKRGRTGLMQTSFTDLPCGSIVANMGILGYAPTRYYPYGRASFEALAQDIFLDSCDLAFRCNLVSIDEQGRMKDFTADNISNENAIRILNSLKFDSSNIELYSGQSYRNILVLRDLDCSAREISSHEPHANIGRPIKEMMLKANGPTAAPIVDMLNQMMLSSIEQLKEINRENPTGADMIWIWSESSAPSLPSFSQRTGLRGAVVAGLDFMRGIGIAAGMVSKEIHGATGYLDSNFQEKLKYTKNYLRNNDFVFLHINAADEEAHAKRVGGKLEALNRVDVEIVEPLVEYLEKNFPDNYRIAVMPDHYTLASDGTHQRDPVPYLIAGAGIQPDGVQKYTENEVAKAYGDRTPLKCYSFMEEFMKDRVEI